MPSYKLKSKIGRSYYAAGVEIGPDEFVELELDPRQLRDLAYQCVPPCAEGGVFDITPDPFGPAREAYKEARGAKGDGLTPAAAMNVALKAYLVGTPNMAAPQAATADGAKARART